MSRIFDHPSRLARAVPPPARDAISFDLTTTVEDPETSMDPVEAAVGLILRTRRGTASAMPTFGLRLDRLELCAPDGAPKLAAIEVNDALAALIDRGDLVVTNVLCEKKGHDLYLVVDYVNLRREDGALARFEGVIG